MQQQDLLTLTIDGREVSVPPGTTILHAAERLGIEIPTFCYSKKMAPLGACRMCLVAVDRAKGFPPACATPVAAGMVVHTITPEVVKTQQGILEFLLINHPLDCPICDKGGECPLQNLTFKYGPGKGRYVEEKRHLAKHLPIGPQIMLDRERCIVCQLCVRFMDDVADDSQLVLLNRGGRTEIGVFPERSFDSLFSGNTTELCPVGALTSRKYRFRARPWDLEHTPSICASCSLGCNVTLDTRRNVLLRLMGRENLAVDDGWLCDRGRYGTLDRLSLGDRIEHPLVRRNGELHEASWPEALAAAAVGLSQGGKGGVAALAGARATNEEYYLLGRLFRGALRSPNILVPQASPAPTAILGGGAIADLEQADVMLLVGADPSTTQPVLDLRIKKQVKRRNAALVVISDAPTGLDYLARATAPIGGAGVLAAVLRLLRLLGAAPESDSSGTTDQGPGIVAATKDLALAVASGVQSMLGTAAQTITADPLDQVVAAAKGARQGVVLYDERLLRGPEARQLSDALGRLARHLAPDRGQDARPLALAAGSNSRGATEMGAHGRWLAGGTAVEASGAGSSLVKAWSRQPVVAAGLDEAEFYAAVETGTMRAVYVLDLDPLADAVAEALPAVEGGAFTVVQAARTSTASLHADVVLPCTDYGESSGTLTNTEGRVQRLTRAQTPPEDAREGWQILCDLEAALGGDPRYHSAEDVTREIARVTGLPSWHGLRQEALEVTVGGMR
jgi:NADH-quinone oxidoreductase subunit G